MIRNTHIIKGNKATIIIIADSETILDKSDMCYLARKLVKAEENKLSLNLSAISKQINEDMLRKE